jgi:hypothetical protein
MTRGDRSPDPVSDPSGYQRHLLALLGDDDPAAVQGRAPDRWRALIEASGERFAVRPEPTEWSALECLGHAVDAEIVSAARYRWILAHDEPPLIGYDQDLWVDRLRHGDDDPAAQLATLGALRAANLDLWRKTSEAQRARIGVHAERGPESLDLLFRLIAGHDRFHLAQAERAVAAAGP